MSAETLTNTKPEKKKRRAQKSQLKVVFDTNALYVTPTSLGSASDLVRPEIASLISEPKYPDLDICWYLPEVVRHERQYQMRTEALKLRRAIDKIERLLGHNLLLPDQTLLDHVGTKIEEAKAKLGLQELTLDHTSVDWRAIIHAAEYRIPPFEAGEREKGFRDAIVAESFLQLLASSPKTPAVCRVVLVTSDTLLSQAVNARIAEVPNAHVLSNIEELKGLINTIVSNAGEEFISQLKPKAAKLFFVSADDKNTLYFKENITEKLKDKFRSLLEALPEGTAFRRNSTWYINNPNFSRKEGRHIFWTSRIEIEVEAGTLSIEEDKPGSISLSTLGRPVTQYSFPLPQANSFANLSELATANLSTGIDWTQYATRFVNSGFAGPSERRVVTQKGRDVFEVLWSTDVTMAKELKKPSVVDIVHIGLNCQPIK
jgi:hypothetical protein